MFLELKYSEATRLNVIIKSYHIDIKLEKKLSIK